MKTTWSVNISPMEPVGRVLVGVVGAVGGVWLLLDSPPAVVAAVEPLLVLVGVDLLVTGAVGHCPLYQRLGHVPRSLRRTS